MAYTALGNPLWSAHLHLMGGLRRLGLSSLVYTMILAGAFVVMVRVGGEPVAAVAAYAIRILGWIQVGLLVVGGASAIHKGQTRDHQTGMLESLRISPLSGPELIIGQLFGPTLFVITWWLVGLIVGVLLTTAGGAGGAREWLFGNMILLLAAASFWSLQIFFGVGYAKPVHIVLFLIMPTFFLNSANGTLRYFPGIALFTGAYGAFQIEPTMCGLVRVGRAEAVAMVIWAVMLLFWSVAAARRFRRPYLPAMNVATSLMLLFLWTACAVAGAMLHNELYPGMSFEADGRGVMAVVMLQTLFIFLCMPIASSMLIRRRLAMGAAPLCSTDSWPPVLVGVACAAIAAAGVVGIGWKLGASFMTSASGATAILITALLGCGLLRLSVFGTGKPGLGWFLLILFWAGPVSIAALVMAIKTQRGTSGEFGVLFASSPLGTAIAAWQNVPAPVWAGLAVQAGVAVGTLFLGAWVERRFYANRQIKLTAEPGAC